MFIIQYYKDIVLCRRYFIGCNRILNVLPTKFHNFYVESPKIFHFIIMYNHILIKIV